MRDWLLIPETGMTADHVNGDGPDYRRTNLRVRKATRR